MKYNVLGIINAVAWAGLVIFALAGLGAIFLGATAGDWSSYYDPSTNEDTLSAIVGIAMIVAAAVHWAFFRAAALVVEYLWEIQARA